MPAFMLALALYLFGRESLVPVVAATSVVVLVALGLLAMNVPINVRAAS